MKVLRILAIVAMLVSHAVLCSAQYTKKALALQSDYNLIQGRKADLAGDTKSACRFFEMAINDDPSNGYAYYYMAISVREDDPDKAIDLFRKALNVAKGDYYLIEKICSWLVNIDPDCKDMEDLLKQLCDACKHLEGVEASYGQYAVASYFSEEQPSEAEQALRESLRIWPLQPYSYSLMGWLRMGDGEFDKAVECFETSLRMSFRSNADFHLQLARIGNRNFKEAIEGLLDIIEDGGSYYKQAKRTLFSGPEWSLNPQFTERDADDFFILAELLMRDRMDKQPNVYKWPVLLGQFNESREHYAAAARYYGIAAKSDSYFNYVKAGAQVSMKDYVGALSSLDEYIGDYPSDPAGYSLRASCREQLGVPDDSVMSDLDKVVELRLDGDSFKSRAWFESMHGRMEDAILDYFMVLQEQPYEAYYHLQRGTLYSIIGERVLAESDLKAALRIAQKRGKENLEYQAFAYARLGMAAEAEKAMEAHVKNDETYHRDVSGAYYNLACVYSVINKPNMSLWALEEAFRRGYDDFNHARRDFDLELVRRDAEFDSLVSKYERRQARKLASVVAGGVAKAERRVIEVPFEKKGGVLSVRCVVNGLPLSFIFDSGASDVSISRVEANFMLANGYIKESDFGDRTYYTVADGSLSAGTKVKLSSVTLGGETLHDVWASVVDGQNSPLLLGQTVMSRLGKVEIDYENKVVRFYR